MAKINGVIQFTGKLGQVVGMKGRNGRNFMRQRTNEVKNPRSQAQCIQRMILATVGSSIAYLKAICNNSVEGKSNGADTLAYLRGEWMRMLRTSDILTSDKSFLKKGDKYFAINPYLLSKGTLVSPKVTIDTSNAAMIVEGMGNYATVTPSQLLPNIRLGDQITFVGVFINDDTGYPEVKYCRFAFKTDQVNAIISGSDLHLNPDAIDLNKAEGDWRSLVFDVQSSQITVDELSPYDFAAGALIVSNEIDKKRSTTYLALDAAVPPFYSAEEAWPTYTGVGVRVDVPSEVYLNNSTDAEAATPSLAGAPVTINRSEETPGLHVEGVYLPKTADLESLRLKGDVYLQSGVVVRGLTSRELAGAATGTSIFYGANYQGFTYDEVTNETNNVWCYVKLPENEQVIDKVVITGGTMRVRGTDYTF